MNGLCAPCDDAYIPVNIDACDGSDEEDVAVIFVTTAQSFRAKLVTESIVSRG